MLEIKPEERKSASILTSMLEKILEHCLGNHSIYIYFAEYYDDRCFRDIYSIYYASKHFAPPRTCSRFFLFDGGKIETIEDETNLNDAFIGTIVRRPLKGREIGRTLVDPRYLYETKNNGDLKCNIWRNKYKITMFGIPLEVWAFPYSMQDGEVSTCAETTILNIMDYYSHRYPDYKRIFPSDISKIVHANSNVTNLPSRGLSYEMVSKVFLEYGFSPILYSAKNFKNKFADILHSYVASGIPVALGINNGENEEIGHSVIVIGTQARLIDTDKENRIKAFKEAPILRLPDNSRDISHYLTLKGAIDSSYIIMDDGRAPYSSAKIYEDNGEVFLQYLPTDEEKWKIAIFAVPMGQEMAMDADAAISCFRSLLVDDVFGYSDYIHRLKGLEEDEINLYEAGLEKNKPLMTRIFLCPSKRLKEQRIRSYEQNHDWKSLDLFQSVHLPRFIWVCELYTEKSFSKDEPEYVGEIILDATTGTSSQDDISNVVWVKYPWKCAYRKLNEDTEVLIKYMEAEVNANREDRKPTTAYTFELH